MTNEKKKEIERQRSNAIHGYVSGGNKDQKSLDESRRRYKAASDALDEEEDEEDEED